MIEVGSLVKTWDERLWLVLDVIADSVLVVNQQTNYKSWGEKSAFEVVAWKFGFYMEVMIVKGLPPFI